MSCWLNLRQVLRCEARERNPLKAVFDEDLANPVNTMSREELGEIVESDLPWNWDEMTPSEVDIYETMKDIADIPIGEWPQGGI